MNALISAVFGETDCTGDVFYYSSDLATVMQWAVTPVEVTPLDGCLILYAPTLMLPSVVEVSGGRKGSWMKCDRRIPVAT